MDVPQAVRTAYQEARRAGFSSVPKAPNRPAVIGRRILAIDYEGGAGKAARSKWTHDFTRANARLLGLKDGSLLIPRGGRGRRLWKLL